MGDEVDVEQAGAPWTEEIGRDAGGSMGEDGAELGERYGLTREAACRTTLVDDVV
jgi:hypothetical protein